MSSLFNFCKRRKILSPLIIGVTSPYEFFRSLSQSKETRLLILKDWALPEAEMVVARQWASEAERHAGCYAGSPLINEKYILLMQLHLLSCEVKACRPHFPLGFSESFEHGWSFSCATTSPLPFLRVFKTEGKTMEMCVQLKDECKISPKGASIYFGPSCKDSFEVRNTVIGRDSIFWRNKHLYSFLSCNPDQCVTAGHYRFWTCNQTSAKSKRAMR